jgi:beta-xylosidase
MSVDARPLLLLVLPLLLGASRPLSTPSRLSSTETSEKVKSRGDFADPFVLRDGDAYYAFATGAAGKHVQVARSRDRVRWATLADGLPRLPAWAIDGFGRTWAPSVIRRGERFVLYYTAPFAETGFQCVSRAMAKKAEGPYVDDSTAPLVCERQLCGAIDPSPVLDTDGHPYLLWKSDENALPCHGVARIWSQPLSEDGLTVMQSPVEVLTMDRDWERPLIEGPSMVAKNGRYFLFYSANWYESANYAIGYATCVSPLGPCEKKTMDAPLFGSAGALLGPGGQELFEDRNGSTWMVFHAWTAPYATYAAGGARSLRFARVNFDSGVPQIQL